MSMTGAGAGAGGTMKDLQFRSDVEVRLIQSVGGDHMVAAAARVSTTGAAASALADPDRGGEVAGLIRYLMSHRHGTPFEHSSLTFFVHAPIFVWREWHRHRVGFSYNEESGRYKQLDPVFYLPHRERPMMRGPNWVPTRPSFSRCEDDEEYESAMTDLKRSYGQSYRVYLRLMNRGLDPGLARSCLPVGIYSSCWVTCNPRSLMAFLALRTHEPTAATVSYPLYEIELAARAAEQIFLRGWPLTHAAFQATNRVAP